MPIHWGDHRVDLPPAWRERLRSFLGALRNAPLAFGLVWEADRASASAMAAVTLLDGLVPVGQAWVGKLIVDSIVGSLRAGLPAREGLRDLLPYVLAELGFYLLSNATSQARQLADKLLDHRLGHLINTRIMRKALSLEARWFEDPEFYDKMQQARRQSEYRAMGIVRAGFMLAQNALTLATFAAVLVSFSPWVALLLFGAAVPAFLVQAHYGALRFRLESWRTPETRSMSYLEQLLTLDTTVKEVKLFGLGEPLLERYARTFRAVFEADAALAKASSLKSFAWGLLAMAAYYGSYVWIAWHALAGRITLGQMTMYVSLFGKSQGTFQGLLDNVRQLYENGLFLDNLSMFLGLGGAAAPAPPGLRPPEDPSRGIELEDVWFRYPGREEWAVSGLSLSVGPSEKLALVGDNGAGKTTLIKLLTRLYEPTKGRILFRGVDLRHYPLEELHARVGAIFQDFVEYHFPLGENIGVGSVRHIEDQARIEASARKSGADAVAESLPKRYGTMLGRWFDGGHELSGGQWQKVALARAFMRDAEVLVLDEPTAALDAGAEYDIFRRFQELSRGKIVLLVSHRFSTVRMADRIAVLKDGRIEELGSHAELVARGGTYARLFELQAQGYR